MSNRDLAVALLGEKKCKDCMRYRGISFPKDPIKQMEMLNSESPQKFICARHFKKNEVDGNPCKHFLYNEGLKNRVIYNLRWLPIYFVILDLGKILSGAFKWYTLLIDGGIILLNVAITVFLQKKYLQRLSSDERKS